MQGTVTKTEFSKSGAQKFCVDGGWYFASRNVDPKGLVPGTAIEFEWEEFGEDRGRGRPRTITRWKPAGQAQNASQNRSNGASQAPTGPSPDVLILPFISNTVAHAIQAGLIKVPADVTPWVLGAKAAMNAKVVLPSRRPSESVHDEPTPDEDFDDEIPF